MATPTSTTASHSARNLAQPFGDFAAEVFGLFLFLGGEAQHALNQMHAAAGE